MLIGPCRVSTSLVYDAEDSIGAHKVPRPNRTAASTGVADEPLGIDGGNAAVGQRSAGRPAIHFSLVDIDAFFILAGGAGRGGIGGARSGRETVTRGLCGRIEIPRIGNVVIDAGQSRAPPVTIEIRPGKESDGFEVLADT
jgi:hypothetical protein